MTIDITATSHTVTYGDAKPTVTPYSYTGWVNSQNETTVTITGLTCDSATYTISTSATLTPSTDCTGATSTNYSFAYVAGSITIQRQPLMITASSPTVTYGDPVPAITPGYVGLVNAETAAANLTTAARCVTAYTVTSNAGTTPSTSCWGATSPNYDISYTAGSVTINRKPITITATSQTVTYGDTTTTLQVLPTVDTVISPTAGTPLTLQASDGVWTGAGGESTLRKWQYSTDAGTTWNDFVPAQTGATYTPPTADLTTRAYRAVVTYLQTDTSTISVAILPAGASPTWL